MSKKKRNAARRRCWNSICTQIAKGGKKWGNPRATYTTYPSTAGATTAKK